jgi:hypothetical protein
LTTLLKLQYDLEVPALICDICQQNLDSATLFKQMIVNLHTPKIVQDIVRKEESEKLGVEPPLPPAEDDSVFFEGYSIDKTDQTEYDFSSFLLPQTDSYVVPNNSYSTDQEASTSYSTDQDAGSSQSTSKQAMIDVNDDEHTEVCQYCLKGFKTQNRLKAHINRIHTNSKIYKCLMCDKEFKSSSGFHYHKKSVHGNQVKEKSVCSFPGCNKLFALESNYKKHLVRNTYYLSINLI